MGKVLRVIIFLFVVCISIPPQFSNGMRLWPKDAEQRHRSVERFSEAVEKSNKSYERRERRKLDRLFIKWKDKSPEGILRFGEKHDVDFRTLQEYMEFGRQLNQNSN